jgi:hypothetical protein
MTNIFDIKINGREVSLNVGKNYFINFIEAEETSFHGLKSEIMDIYWKDESTDKTYFFIYVHDHKEDYLISDAELLSVKLAELQAGKNYKFIFENGSTTTGEFLELKVIGNEIHSVWIDFGRQPVYLNYKEIWAIEEIKT